MASGGGEQGYWPGFVDALSNMVMTLIIIIVLLNVALVYFVLKANKNTSQSVQTAVETAHKSSAQEIEALQSENQRLQAELVEALGGDARESAKKPYSVPKKENTREQPADPVPQEKQEEKQEEKQTEKQVREKQAGLQTGLMVPEAVLRNRTAPKDESDKNAIRNDVLSYAGNLIIISYEDDNVEFSAKTLHALDDVLDSLIPKDKNIRIDITVEIIGGSRYSYMRRTAFYRASSIRNYFLGKGFDPKRIVSHLVDADEEAQYPRALIRFDR